MVVEFHGPRPLLNVPEHTRHVAGRGDDLPVVYEAAAAEVPGVCAELSGDLDLPARRARPRSAQGVDGADVVEATAGDEVPGGGIGGGHDPGGAEWDGVDLVGGVGIPDDELAVLGGGDDVAGVGGPVEGVDLGEVALERAAGLEGDAGEGGRVRRHRAHWLSAGGAGGGLTACVGGLVPRRSQLVLQTVRLPPRGRDLVLDVLHGGRLRGGGDGGMAARNTLVGPIGRRRVEARAHPALFSPGHTTKHTSIMHIHALYTVYNRLP